jgi:hypothetical protein
MSDKLVKCEISWVFMHREIGCVSPWVMGMHGVPWCGKTQHCTCTCDTRDWKTVGLPILCYSLGTGCAGKGVVGCGCARVVLVCGGVVELVGAVQLCWMQGIGDEA